MIFDSSLTPARRKLTRLMQEIHFGCIQYLEVRRGQPVFDPPPKVVRMVKLHVVDGSQPERKARDFSLKAPLVALFRHLDDLGNGTVLSIDVKHGLPFLVQLEHRA